MQPHLMQPDKGKMRSFVFAERMGEGFCSLPRADDVVPVFGLYREPTERFAANFVHLDRIESSPAKENWRIDMHQHAHFYQAVLITTGQGVLWSDETQTELTGPCIVWLPVGVVHGFSFAGPSTGMILTISADVLLAATENAPEGSLLGSVTENTISAPLFSDMDINIDLATVFETIERECMNELQCLSSVIESLLRLVLVGLARTVENTTIGELRGRAHVPMYREFRKLMETHFRDHWSVARYAAEIGIRADRLHAVCTEAVGESPRDLLANRLMLEAKRKLIYTNRRISDISFALGYRDPAYFSRLFAKKMGMSATQFRNIHSGNENGSKDACGLR